MTADEALKYFGEWKDAYQLAFGKGDSPAFDDLAEFCHAQKTTAIPGDRDETLIREGRRQVILRIRNFLDLTPEQLVKLHTRPAQGAISHDRTDPSPDA